MNSLYGLPSPAPGQIVYLCFLSFLVNAPEIAAPAPCQAQLLFCEGYQGLQCWEALGCLLSWGLLPSPSPVASTYQPSGLGPASLSVWPTGLSVVPQPRMEARWKLKVTESWKHSIFPSRTKES